MSTLGREYVLTAAHELGLADTNPALAHPLFSGEVLPIAMPPIRIREATSREQLREGLDPYLKALVDLEIAFAGGEEASPIQNKKALSIGGDTVCSHLAHGASTGTLTRVTAELVHPNELGLKTRQSAFQDIESMPTDERTRLTIVIGGMLRYLRTDPVGSAVVTWLRTTEGDKRQIVGTVRTLREHEIKEFVVARRQTETDSN